MEEVPADSAVESKSAPHDARQASHSQGFCLKTLISSLSSKGYSLSYRLLEYNSFLTYYSLAVCVVYENLSRLTPDEWPKRSSDTQLSNFLKLFVMNPAYTIQMLQPRVQVNFQTSSIGHGRPISRAIPVFDKRDKIVKPRL